MRPTPLPTHRLGQDAWATVMSFGTSQMSSPTTLRVQAAQAMNALSDVPSASLDFTHAASQVDSKVSAVQEDGSPASASTHGSH